MRALVVGASGFVGGHLVRHLLENGDEVIATTREGEAVGPALGCQSVALDITKGGACSDLVQQYDPDVVYHLAAIAFVPEAEADFESTLRVNVAGTSNIVRACHLLGRAVRFLFVSSAEVYGQVHSNELPISEGNPLRPANNYSLSKRMAELVVDRYARAGSVAAVTVRPFNHIGPGQDARFVASNFAYQLARIAHGVAAPILETGNLEARRDFSDVRDIVRAYRLLALTGTGIYNLGTGTARSIQSLLDTLIRVSGVRVEVRQDPSRMRGPEVPELYTLFDRAREECGWTPTISFEQSMQDIFRYWFDRIAVDKAV